MKTSAAMQNAIGCIAVFFFSRVPALSRAHVVHIWTLVLEKHGLSLVVNCFVYSLLDRQGYYKKVVQQCVVIPAIHWLTSKFLFQLQIGHFISNQAKPWSELILVYKDDFLSKTRKKKKNSQKLELSQINHQIVQSLLNSFANSVSNLVLNSVFSLTPHTFTIDILYYNIISENF